MTTAPSTRTSEPTANPPGFYKVISQKIGFAGLVRTRGLLRAPLAYLITRFKKPSTFTWAPSTWAELHCEAQDLSRRFHEIATGPADEFQRLGFTKLGFCRNKEILSRIIQDSGSISYLDGSRAHFGQLLYIKTLVPPPVSKIREKVVISFIAVFSEGLLSCTNSKGLFPRLPHYEVVRLQTTDVETIHRSFLEHLAKRKEAPRSFPDDASFHRWFDANHQEVLDYRVRTGMYVKMTDDEVAAARRKLPPPLPTNT